MKLSDGVINCPDTGICEIDVKKICSCFGLSFISKYEEDYRLHNSRAHVKVNISKEDALKIIKEMKMQEHAAGIFVHASNFYTEKYLAWDFAKRKKKQQRGHKCPL